MENIPSDICITPMHRGCEMWTNKLIVLTWRGAVLAEKGWEPPLISSLYTKQMDRILIETYTLIY